MLNMLVFTRMPRPRRPTRPGRPSGATSRTVFVGADARNSGVGRQLLDAATAYAEEHGFARIVLSPSERSVPFYARAGFVPATASSSRRSDRVRRPSLGADGVKPSRAV